MTTRHVRCLCVCVCLSVCLKLGRVFLIFGANLHNLAVFENPLSLHLTMRRHFTSKLPVYVTLAFDAHYVQRKSTTIFVARRVAATSSLRPYLLTTCFTIYEQEERNRCSTMLSCRRLQHCFSLVRHSFV